VSVTLHFSSAVYVDMHLLPCTSQLLTVAQYTGDHTAQTNNRRHCSSTSKWMFYISLTLII